MKRFTALLGILILLLSGCTPHRESAQVAATTLPVYEFTARITQDTGITVTRLVTESVSCLHDYSLNVRQVRAVESAEVIVISGGGLEDFMHDLLESKDYTVDASQGIALLACSHLHDQESDHGHHHEADAHFWLSPGDAMTMAKNICTGLSGRYPEHAEAFQNNLSLLLSDLEDLQEYGETTLSGLSCRELITFHDGFSYFAHSFDLEILEAVEEESGSEASAQELKHLISLVESHELPAIFTEVSGSTSAAEMIARETGAKLFPLDMAMSGDSYFTAMYHNIDTIKEALQ